MAHFDFIDDNTLNFLAKGIQDESLNGQSDIEVVDRGAAKSFFKNIHAKKRTSIMKLQGEKIDGKEITAFISAKVRAAFLEDHTGKKVTVFEEFVGEKVKKVSNKDKENEPAEKEAGNVNLAGTTNSHHTEAYDDNQHPVAKGHESLGANITEEHHGEIGKSAEIINIASTRPSYVKLLEGQANRLLEIAKIQGQPLQVAEYVESVITTLTEALTEIRTFAEETDFREAA